jgi:hypothetical protein
MAVTPYLTHIEIGTTTGGRSPVRDNLTFLLAKFFLFLSGLFHPSHFSVQFYGFEIILGTLLHRQIIFSVPLFPLLHGPRYVLRRESSLLVLLT